MVLTLFATLSALAAPTIVGTYQEPQVCYAEDGLELWVEVSGDDVAFAWEASDELYDWGGSIDVVDEDGIFLTCPACPPAEDGDTFVVSLVVTDSSGAMDSADWEIEVSCGSNTGKVDGGCMTSQAAGGLLLVLGMVGLRQRRRV